MILPNHVYTYCIFLCMLNVIDNLLYLIYLGNDNSKPTIEQMSHTYVCIVVNALANNVSERHILEQITSVITAATYHLTLPLHIIPPTGFRVQRPVVVCGPAYCFYILGAILAYRRKLPYSPSRVCSIYQIMNSFLSLFFFCVLFCFCLLLFLALHFQCNWWTLSDLIWILT